MSERPFRIYVYDPLPDERFNLSFATQEARDDLAAWMREAGYHLDCYDDVRLDLFAPLKNTP